MATCLTTDNDGDLVLDPSTIETCLGFVALEPAEYHAIIQPIDLALLGITPAEILFVLTWGMGVVLMMWKLGYALKWVLKILKLI
ncbi:MAG: hypothetical protein COA38_21785 [Fluviicola sp.]|nr:MAG: hypothetical protein COA38_21785 [Fluviicola sp.]